MHRMLKGCCGVRSSCSGNDPDFHEREACAILREWPLLALLRRKSLVGSRRRSRPSWGGKISRFDPTRAFAVFEGVEGRLHAPGRVIADEVAPAPTLDGVVEGEVLP